MNAGQVNEILGILQTQLYGILDPDYTDRVIGRAQKDVAFSEDLYYKYRDRSDVAHPNVTEGWGFKIDDPPLRFARTDIHGYQFAVDVLCDFRWKDDLPCKRSIVLRLWSQDDRMFVREDWDSTQIIDLYTKNALTERVMARFHFEEAVLDTPEPPYHMHIGGLAKANEFCWLHPKIDVPRFPFPPMDLVLMCELVGANFYPQTYRKIRNDSTWKGCILKSQDALLRRYFEDCCKDIGNHQTIFSAHLD